MSHFKHREHSPFFQDGARKYLDQAERQRFLKYAARAEIDISLFCQVIAHTGCRISEALNLRPSHICIDRQAIIFETLKQRGVKRFRQVPIPKSLLKALVTWIDLKPFSDARLWPIHRQTGWRWVKKVMRKAKIIGDHATPRGLRHSFAVNALWHAIPIVKVQKWLGHSKIDNTTIYTNVVGPEELCMAKRMWRSNSQLKIYNLRSMIPIDRLAA